MVVLTLNPLPPSPVVVTLVEVTPSSEISVVIVGWFVTATSKVAASDNGRLPSLSAPFSWLASAEMSPTSVPPRPPWKVIV